MKNLKLVLFIIIIFTLSTAFKEKDDVLCENSCDVVEFYEEIKLKSGSKVLGSFGSLSNAETVLVPVRVRTGTYKIKITKTGTNLYRIKLDNSEYYMETKFCSESAMSDDAILKIDSDFFSTKGLVCFQ